VSEHPASEEIAAYLSDALTPPDRAKLEAHLADCRSCRHEVTAARRLLRVPASRNRLRWAVPAVAAAALAGIVFVSSSPDTPFGQGELVRGEQGTEAPMIQALSPANGATVDRGAVVFVWRHQVGNPLYRLTLTDGSARVVWTMETSDTTLTLPADVSLAPGRTYFWLVDALGADGRSLTTGNQRFTTAP
jgi:hypothetical protein